MSKRRILLSFLGTGSYTTCSYKLQDSKDAFQSRFFQESLIRALESNHYVFDKVYIFVTEKAKKTNWENVEAKYPDQKAGVKQGDVLEGLKSILEYLKKDKVIGDFKLVDFPEINEKKELLNDMFKIIYDVIEKEAEITLDITHSFRFMPMLVIPILNYARFLKKININDIYYGAFEILGKPQNVSNLDLSDRIAPIFSLKWLNDIQELTNATNDFVNFGITDKILCRFKNDEKSHNFAKQLNSLSKDILSCRGQGLFKGYNFDINLSDHELFKDLFNEASKKVNSFEKENIKNIFCAVKWCYEHKLIQQGFTFLRELILIFIFLKILKEDNSILLNNNLLETLAAYLNVLRDKIPRKKWKGRLLDKKGEIRKKVNDWDNNWKDQLSKYSKLFKEVCDIRNDIDHSGFRKEPISYSDLEEKFKEKIKETEELLNF